MSPALYVALAFLALQGGVLGPSCTVAAPQGASVLAKQMFSCTARVSGSQHAGNILTDSNLVDVWKRGKGKQPDRYVGSLPCARRITL